MRQSSLAAADDKAAALLGGRYQIGRLLGQGGMGAVYEAVDRVSGTTIAIKRLAANASDKTQTLFEREYRTLSGLRHPCIVEVYDYGTDHGGSYYTMELLDGHDLAKRAPVPWRKACAYLRDAASILGLLHARRLLHRDLSPRNLLENRNGRLKLIDFGALADFGVASELVGTPPFVSPEALRGAELDQRSDLFALGALGYWLLTGTHAYPARTLGDLPQLWQREPAPPSRQVAAIGGDLLEPVPPELDELFGALLRTDASERPQDTAELIDRLNLVAELPPEAEELASAGYLASKVFVGRARERERFSSALADARTGRGQALVVEGDAGVGRTRFLQELAVTARLTGAITLELDAARGRKPYALAETLLLHLLRAHPREMKSAIGAHAPLLASLSRELRTTLAVNRPPKQGQSAGEERALLQNALLETLLSFASTRLVALFIDDLQAVDEESQALLAALAHVGGEAKLCLLASLARDANNEPSPAVVSLRGSATRLRLLPLTGPETLALLRSVFGSARYLERLAERLHRASEGNPAHCLELAQHLVTGEQARYHEGSWALPPELSADSLPSSRAAGLLARLERVPALARSLAQKISVPHSGAWSLPQVCAAAEVSETQARELLAQLARERVLRGLEQGYRFAHEQLRETLCGELDHAARAAVHARVARAVLATAPDIDANLVACVHFLRADDLRRAFPLLKLTLRYYRHGDLSGLGSHASRLEEIHHLLRQAKQDDHAQAGVLALLAVAGYFSDRRYAERYGELAIETMARVLKLELARKWAPRFGRKLALIFALVVAAFGFLRSGVRVTSLGQTIRYLVAAVSALAGASAVCLDGPRAMRYAKVIEPLSVLGPDNGATIVYDFSLMLGYNSCDDTAESVPRLKAMMARLESPRPINGLPGTAKSNYYAGCMLVRGVYESWRGDARTLATADELERFSPLYAMNADQLRADYYGSQGQLAQAQKWRRKLEVHAVQLGSAWQVETWAPASAVATAMRVLDASMMKRALQDLDRLLLAVPSLTGQAQHARGGYLLLRGKPKQAAAVLEACTDQPGRSMNWLRMRGMLAQAYNELGQHERAREVAMHALALASEEQLARLIFNLDLQLQLALAESALGHHQLAELQLKKLFERARANDPITLAMLHDTGARLALAKRDFAAARTHASSASEHVKPLSLPGWSARLRTLGRVIRRTEDPHAEDISEDDLLDVAQHVMTRVQLMLSKQDGEPLPVRARRGLQVALELSSAEEGFILIADSAGSPVAHLGSTQPSRELVGWAEQSLLDASVDEQTVMTEEVASQFESNYKAVGSVRYLVAPLWARSNGQDGVVAALVLGFDNRVPRMPEPQVLHAIAAHLLA